VGVKGGKSWDSGGDGESSLEERLFEWNDPWPFCFPEEGSLFLRGDSDGTIVNRRETVGSV
jgi:hypothetical protein